MASSLFPELTSNFNRLTQQMFGFQMGVDPAIDAQIMMQKNNGSSINSQLLVKFMDISKTKSGIISDIDTIRDFYFSQLIVDRILDDALNVTGNESNLFKVKINNSRGEIDEAATALIDDFIDEFNIQKLIIDVAADLLYYGEYFLRLDVNSFGSENENKKGVFNIHDDVDITKNIPVFRDSDVSYILSMGKKKIETIQPTNLVYFSMPSSRIKIKMDGLSDKIIYLRMGKSILYPVYGLLKELKFLEAIIPLGFINDSLATKLVSVNVPSTTKPADAQKIAQTFEKMINKSLTIKNSSQSDEEIIKTISSKVGEVKVIPNFGDKGDLNAEDFNSENNYDDMSDKIYDLRKMILSTIGLPSSIIDEEGIKSDVIKDHIRYTKKLKSIQFALKEGLQRLLIVHLTNNGFDNYMKEDIQVTFLNVLNTDDLEKLEYIDLTVSMLDNFKSFVDDFDDNEHIDVKYEEYTKFMNAQFENITGFQLFEYKNQDNENTDDENTDGSW
jgi:hypothetical protein